MRSILPRLRNLLSILVRDAKPVPVAEMADRLRVSRRTVFRELRNVDAVLAPYGLGIGSRPGEGLVLEGSGTARDRLEQDLEIMGGGEPADRRERHQRLILALVREPGRKLFFYADCFRVSAATISHDLDDIEPWLAGHRLSLLRKSGSGINLGGSEADRRRAILAIMHARRRDGGEPLDYPDPEIGRDLDGMAAELDGELAWMTPQSREAIGFYLAVMVQRVMGGEDLSESGAVAEFRPAAGNIADILEDGFGIALGAPERNALSIELAACRPNADTRALGVVRDPRLEGLAHRMIERYDPGMSPLLRLDEALVDGLVSHLRSATIRLAHRMELPDPLLEQMLETYPEVMTGCRRAAEELAPPGGWLPESEISFLAAHFGAAELRLSERGLRSRMARIGVVCIHGIGTSYLLASQVRKAFGNDASAEVSWWGDSENWKHFDFLVSTTPLDECGLPVVVVAPILDDDAVSRIGAEIRRVSREAAPAAPSAGARPLAEECAVLEALAGDVRRILERFAVHRVSSECVFTDLAEAAAGLLAERFDAAEAIRASLLDREALSSQVIPELGLVLLHCRTGGVERPVVALLVPERGEFADPYFRRARSCMVMLVPDGSPRWRGELMGEISASLIKDGMFLAAVLAADAERVRTRLEGILRGFVLRHVNDKMKG